MFCTGCLLVFSICLCFIGKLCSFHMIYSSWKLTNRLFFLRNHNSNKILSFRYTFLWDELETFNCVINPSAASDKHQELGTMNCILSLCKTPKMFILMFSNDHIKQTPCQINSRQVQHVFQVCGWNRDNNNQSTVWRFREFFCLLEWENLM